MIQIPLKNLPSQELQVVLEPHRDARKNLVGKIVPEELVLLPFIKPWSKFHFAER